MTETRSRNSLADVKEDASSGKTFEERLAELVMPEPVHEPDQDVVKNKFSSLNAQIDKCDERLNEIKPLLAKATANRGESKGIVEQLKGVRARINAASQEREEAFQQLRDMGSHQNSPQDSESKSLLGVRRAEAKGRLDEATTEADELKKLLEAARAKQQAEGGEANVNELWKEQKELYGQIRNNREEIRKVNPEFKDQVNKFRDYQRLLGNYKRALQRIQGDQRRADWKSRQSRRAEAVKAPGDKVEGLPSKDSVVEHPWQEEKRMSGPPPPGAISAPRDANENTLKNFTKFAIDELQNDSFVRWVPPSLELDAALANTVRSAHAKERTDERVKHGLAELERSLRSAASYRAMAEQARVHLWTGGYCFNFTRDGSRLLSHTERDARGNSSPLPPGFAAAALGAVAAAVAGTSKTYKCRGGLASEIADEARMALAGAAGGGVAWKADFTLVALTNTAKLVFSRDGGQLITVIEKRLEDWLLMQEPSTLYPQPSTNPKP